MEMGPRQTRSARLQGTARKGMLVVRTSQELAQPWTVSPCSCLPHPAGPVPEWRPKSPRLLCCVYGPLLSAPNGLEAGSELVNEVQQEVTRSTRV